jgi:hypothetical protein
VLGGGLEYSGSDRVRGGKRMLRLLIRNLLDSHHEPQSAQQADIGVIGECGL